MNTVAKFVLLLILVIAPSQSFAIRLAKITVHVIGEDKQPISGAEVWMSRDSLSGPVESIGESDSNGNCSFTTVNYNGYVSYGASKEGYYKSYNKAQFSKIGFMHFKPWNATFEITIRKIENPIPMYARVASLEIPKIDEPIGFDLIKYDWVKPYGIGVISDFIFKIEKNIISNNDFTSRLTISFNSEHDGILTINETLETGSEFHLPRYAPLDGYSSLLINTFSLKPGDFYRISSTKEDNHLFKVRSNLTQDGMIKSMYGKIHGPIHFHPLRSKTAGIYFKYFINPDHTPNLEFDPSKNLFSNLRTLEKINRP